VTTTIRLFISIITFMLFFSSLAQANENSKRLYYAAKGGYLQAAKELVEKKGASVHYVDINGETALLAACKSGNYPMVQFLIEKRSKVNARDKAGSSCMHIASKRKNIKLLNLLISKGGSVNINNDNGVTPLHEAAAVGSFEIAQLLISKGANIRATTTRAWLPLHHAARFGHTRVASMLLQRGTPIYLRTSEGKTVFDLARTTKDRTMLRFLSNYAKRSR